MADVHIDANQLTYQSFLITGDGPVVAGTATVVASLPGGEYLFRSGGDGRGLFRFVVTADGTVDFDAENDSFLSGRGGDTLTVRGVPVILDATGLSHNIGLLGIDGEGFSFQSTHELRLVPGGTFQLRGAVGIAPADLVFSVDNTAAVVLDARSAAFAHVDGMTLTVDGYRVTIDGRALTHGLRPLLLGWPDDAFWAPDATHDITLMPGMLELQPAAAMVADFAFTLDVDGTMLLAPQFDRFARVEGRTLRVDGCQVTVDGRSLAANLEPSGWSAPLSRESIHDVTLIPARGYKFAAINATVADFEFSVDADAAVTVDPRFAGFAHGEDHVLVIDGGPLRVMPADLWSRLDPNLPVALLPVRLETRFGTRRQARRDGPPVDVAVLRVRMYPDDLTVVAGSTGLSDVERSVGAAFWDDHDRAASGAEVDDPAVLEHRRSAAWEVLTRRVGVARAAFVAEASRPGAAGAPSAEAAPAHARLLPDAWAVIGHRGGSRVFTALVPLTGDTVQMGPSTGGDGPLFDPADALLVHRDDALRWVSDFEAAEAIGMAVTIDLQSGEQAAAGEVPEVAAHGLDSLVVLGVREPRPGRDPLAEAAALGEVFSVHSARDHLGFVAQGTPTNNFAGRRSGWTGDADVFAGYRRLFQPPAVTPPATAMGPLRGGGDNAATLAAALGVGAEIFAAAEGAELAEQWWARCMNRALFPVTVGETLASLVKPDGVDDATLASLLNTLDEVVPFAEDHVSSFVRARGPLPALRVGAQPYGWLPILPARRWAARPGDPRHLGGLVARLASLRPFWEHATATMETVDGATAEAGAASDALVRILTHGPVPHPGGYLVTDVLGPALASALSYTRLGHLEGANLFSQIAVRDSVSAQIRTVGYRSLVAAIMGLPKDSLLEGLNVQGRERLWVSVASSDPLRRRYETPAVYLRRLVSGNVKRYFSAFFPQGDNEPKPDDLLFVLLEHSLAVAGELDVRQLLALVVPPVALAAAAPSAEVARSGLSAAGAVQRSFTTSITALAAGANIAQLALSPNLAEKTAVELVSDHVDDLIAELHLEPHHLRGFPGTRDAIAALADANLSDDDYTRLLGEALACCANRLDAWFTSLATQRLAQLRAERPTGVQLGSWGVVINVAPAANAVAAPPGWAKRDGADGAAPADAARGPLLGPRHQVGYVHAPSLAQARTAGVLRAGELTHHSDNSSLASIDLTSRRVRIGRDMLEGVANGQPLGALLGYRLERALGDAGLHGAVETLRQKFPQRRHLDPAGAGDVNVVPPEVVDGVEVWNHRDEVAGEVALNNDGDRQAFAAALGELAVASEAVADLLVAEGLHHITSGRPEAAGATFSAVANGGHPPLSLDVTRAPRSGASIDHRVLVILDGVAATPGWDPRRPRAVIAPDVEKWVGSIIGPPGDWHAQVSGTQAGGPQAGTALTAVVAVDSLGALCALDVVNEVTTALGGHSVFARRLAAAVGCNSDVELAAAGPGRPFDELVQLCGAVQAVLSGARGAQPGDVMVGPQQRTPTATAVTGPPPPAVADLEAVAARIADVIDDLARAAAAVGDVTAPDSAATPTPSELDAFVAPFAALSLPGSLMAAGTVTVADVSGAAAAAAAVVADVERLIGAAITAGAAPATTLRQRLLLAAAAPRGVDVLTTVARRVGGDIVVPTVAVANELAANLVSGAVAPPPDAVEGWLGRMARVRNASAGYDDLRLFCEATGRALPDLCVAQLPLVAAEGWLGGQLATAAGANELRGVEMAGERVHWVRPDGPRGHVVIAGPAPGDTTVALVIDEFSEVLTASSVTTGVAIHYDAPAARPPQTALLAVHPDPATPWGWEILEDTVFEAIALARMRTAELDELAATSIGEYVPLTYIRDGLASTTPLKVLTARPRWVSLFLDANRYMVNKF